MIINKWFVLLSRSLAALYLYLATAVIISYINPINSFSAFRQYMMNMMMACMHDSLMGEIMRLSMRRTSHSLTMSLFYLIAMVTGIIVPFGLIVGMIMRRKLHEN